MKIYIINILPHTLTNKLPKIIEEFGIPEEKIKYELYSKEFGIHTFENEFIFHNESKFETVYELIKGYNNYDLLVDKTNYKQYEQVSQLPVNYICTIITEFKFKLHKKSNISFIIECIEETINFEKKIIPINYYFDYEDKNLDLNNSFFKEDFNRFLSHLN
jgi:hypothetical protein